MHVGSRCRTASNDLLCSRLACSVSAKPDQPRNFSALRRCIGRIRSHIQPEPAHNNFTACRICTTCRKSGRIAYRFHDSLEPQNFPRSHNLLVDRDTRVELALSVWRTDVLPLHQYRIFRAGAGKSAAAARPVFPGGQHDFRRGIGLQTTGSRAGGLRRGSPVLRWCGSVLPNNQKPNISVWSTGISDLFRRAPSLTLAAAFLHRKEPICLAARRYETCGEIGWSEPELHRLVREERSPEIVCARP